MLENKRGVIPVIVIIAIIVVLLIGTSSIVYLTNRDKGAPQEEGEQEEEIPDGSDAPPSGGGDEGGNNGIPSGGGGGSRDGSQGGGSSGGNNPPGPGPEPPGGFDGMNIVVILTDDQRRDTLEMEIEGRKIMPIVESELVEKGVKFNNAIITTPLCCPFRASFLSGGFTSNNAFVRDNSLPNGGAAMFQGTDSIAISLQEKGYKTAMLGKYLNDFNLVPKVPEGWDTFVGYVSWNGQWDDSQVLVGGKDKEQGGNGNVGSRIDEEQRKAERIEQVDQYVTYYLRDEALKFIDKHANEPFFLYVSHKAPHAPSNAAPEDRETFSQEEVNEYITTRPSYKEEDLGDKPLYIREGCVDPQDPRCDPGQLEFARKQLQALQSVDRTVGDIINKLEQHNLLDNTIIIFTSDNGMLWGEHWFSSKGKPYQEASEVPLVIRAPGINPGIRDEIVAVNLDVPETVLSLAGSDENTEGVDLRPTLLGGDANEQRGEGVLIQSWTKEGNDAPDWAAWRIKDMTYVLYESGEEELYDLVNDPYEIESQHDNPEFSSIKQQLRSNVEANLGLSVLTDAVLPSGVIGQQYTAELEPWGGTGPYMWSMFEGSLPKGLTLRSDGTISGTIAESEIKGTKKFSIAVEEGVRSPYNEEFGRHVQAFEMDLLKN